jgi:hypothetical protein
MRLPGMLSRVLPLALGLWLAACAAATPQPGQPTAAPATVSPAATAEPAAPRATATAAAARAAGVDRAAATITPAGVRDHVAFLASDEMRGRDTPSPELERAARYLADQFRELGLRPAGDDGSYEQRFPMESVRLDRGALRVEARIGGETLRPEFGTGFFVLPSRADSAVGTPHFAGVARRGVTLPPTARGRIAVFFVPDTLGPNWQVAVASALQASFAAQAGGAVLVLDSAFTSESFAMLADQTQHEVAPLPVVGMRYDVARTIFRAAGMDLGAVRGRTGPLSPMEGVTMVVHTPLSIASVAVPNVVAYLPGSHPTLRDEYVVYSAHFDHVGVGTPDMDGDSIYNGADDNASGTSAVLAIARAFASLDRAPARSVMFVMVSGEEKGLLGSRHFVEHPPVPVNRMVANINADMVGRNAPDTVVAIGQDYSTIGALVQDVAARHPELGLVVAPDLWPDEQLFFRSDHFSFAARGVPAIFFTTGLHEQYHRPGDVVELIDEDKLARIAQLLFRIGLDIAERPERPEWTDEGRANVPRVPGS